MSSAIQTSQWKINESPLDYDKELTSWIKKTNADFRNRGSYEPFEIYKEQSVEWVKDPISFSDCRDFEEQVWWLKREHRRCKENTLYYANKYGKLKDAIGEGGVTDFQAWEAQKMVFHILDRGYSVMLGKGRQFGFTSAMGLYSDKKINFNKNLFIKFVTHSAEKGAEIFNDKIKWPFAQIPDYLRHEVMNDRDNLLRLDSKEQKGKTVGMGSAIKVDSPAIDAINGGSPDIVLIDEIGLFDLFGMMMREGRPTMFRFNPLKNRQELVRQLVAWGTGGQMGAGATAFEEEFTSLVNQFNEGKLTSGILPIFFNAFAREGFTKEMYESEKQIAYNIQGHEGELARIQFHQHYPMTIEDMFLRTAATLKPISYINERLHHIYGLPEKPMHGYFEPIHNNKQQIVDCTFIPVDDSSDIISPVTILAQPEIWEHRYYQGTDPINSESGHSKMGSAIWDAQTNKISGYVNYRDKDLKFVYSQVMMLGMYYKPKECAPELTEANIGDFYKDYKSEMGYEHSLVAQKMLPQFLQINTQKWWGINNKAQTNGKIIQKLIELLDGYGTNINVVPFWVQMKTFVEKSLVTKGGNANNNGRISRYQAANLRTDFDDIIFAIVYAYINMLSHQRYEPKQVTSSSSGSPKTFKKYVQNAQTGYKMRLCLVNEHGKVLKVGAR
jgi:hypothetical protein